MRRWAEWVAVFTLASGCAVTGHETQRSTLGTVRSTSDLLAVIDLPGPIEVETVTSTNWSIDLSALLNLDSAKAKEAGLKNRLEPVQIFFHALRHPEHGLYIVDTGIERRLRDAPQTSPINGVVAAFFHPDRMDFKEPLGDWLAKQPPLKGVLLTHAHIDHISGMPDVPPGTPIYCGQGDLSATSFANLFIRGTMDGLLEGQDAVSEWQFAADPDGRFSGVIDVFGDGSLWAIWVPGHTPGSTAYLARTPKGPVLLTGDTSHTAWGWENGVEPGTFTGDHAQNLESLNRLRQLAAEHPGMDVRLGHQHLHPAP